MNAFCKVFVKLLTRVLLQRISNLTLFKENLMITCFSLIHVYTTNHCDCNEMNKFIKMTPCIIIPWIYNSTSKIFCNVLWGNDCSHHIILHHFTHHLGVDIYPQIINIYRCWYPLFVEVYPPGGGMSTPRLLWPSLILFSIVFFNIHLVYLC